MGFKIGWLRYKINEYGDEKEKMIKQNQVRIGRKMYLKIKKVQTEYIKKKGGRCSFAKASNLLCERYRKK